MKQGIKNTLKTVAGAGLGALLSVAPVEDANAQQQSDIHASNVEYHVTGGDNKARLNTFYSLPGDVNVYSFVELYKDVGFLAKNSASKTVGNGFSIEARTKHSNVFPDRAGVGMGYSAELPGGIGTKGCVIPVWVNKNGVMDHQSSLGYSVRKSFPVSDKLDLKLSSFGIVNAGAKNGATWSYGESQVGVSYATKQGQFDFGVGYNHNASGELAPSSDFRLSIGYHPLK